MESTRFTDVLCLGIFVADALGRPIERMPEWRQLALVERVELHVGGCANNTATGLARLGLKVGVIGRIGNDGFGDFILKHLSSEHIDVRGLRKDEKENTSFTFVMIAPDGERAFFHYVGANGAFCYDDIDFSLIEDSRILHVAGSFVMPGLDGEPTAMLLKKAKEMGVVTSLDTVWNGSIDAYETLKPSLPYLDYLLPSIEEARLMAGHESPRDVADFFISHGVGTVGLKMGAEGSFVKSRDEEVMVRAFRVNAVDTSGAGDSWIAGFLAGIHNGWDLEKSARLGSAMGALCATSIGTTSGLRGWEETIKFMKEAEVL
ncbi:MAG: sugar kinase [Armatimonadetes bacterium]|nr:sugar kinase [Armatimonadota bacterium]